MIDLSRCTTVKSADLKAHKKHSFEISTPDTTYLLYAGECINIMCCEFIAHYSSFVIAVRLMDPNLQ